jgi:citrate lyase beta subunit
MAAVANSASAVQLDGAMVDVPVIKRAEAIIRDYEALASRNIGQIMAAKY